MSILLLSGSPSLASKSVRILRHIGNRLDALGYEHSLLQVRELPAQALLHADFGNPDLQAAKFKIARAQAIVIGTPIYKASFSGVLKTFLDILPQDGLEGKLILPLATGGSQSHMLALDYGLRPVLSALGARHVLSGIYATDAQISFTDDELSLDAPLSERLDKGVNSLIRNLELSPAARLEAIPAASFLPMRCSA